MNRAKALALFLFFVSLSAVGAEIRLYFCESERLKITIWELISDHEFDLKIEMNDRELKLSQKKVKEKTDILEVSANSDRGIFSFAPTKPKDLMPDNQNEFIVNKQKTKTLVTLATDNQQESYIVECQIIDLSKTFLDGIFTKFP